MIYLGYPPPYAYVAYVDNKYRCRHCRQWKPRHAMKVWDVSTCKLCHLSSLPPLFQGMD